MEDPIRLASDDAEWIIDREAEISANQMQRVLSRARLTDGYEIDLDYLTRQCLELFGKQVQIWRVPGTRTVFSVAARPASTASADRLRRSPHPSR
jgi:hypothetical protein